jgi:preprotein translocase subunit SecG
MENVVLIVHLLLALGIIAVVLLQRSEGGALGIGGGGGSTASRPPLGALGKVTWALGIAFILTSMTLTVIAADKAAGVSILDRLGIESPAPTAPIDAPGGSLLPPTLDGGGSLIPPPAD